jgi:hypothetical protein
MKQSHGSPTREASNPNDWLRTRLVAPEFSLRCASMRRKIALDSPGIWGSRLRWLPSCWSRFSPGLQA